MKKIILYNFNNIFLNVEFEDIMILIFFFFIITITFIVN